MFGKSGRTFHAMHRLCCVTGRNSCWWSRKFLSKFKQSFSDVQHWTLKPPPQNYWSHYNVHIVQPISWPRFASQLERSKRYFCDKLCAEAMSLCEQHRDWHIWHVSGFVYFIQFSIAEAAYLVFKNRKPWNRRRRKLSFLELLASPLSPREAGRSKWAETSRFGLSFSWFASSNGWNRDLHNPACRPHWSWKLCRAGYIIWCFPCFGWLCQMLRGISLAHIQFGPCPER